MKSLFPYETLFGELRMSIAAVRVDGKDPGIDLRDAQHRLVTAHGLERPDWGSLELELRIEGPADELSSLDAEQRGPQVLAVAFCRPTNERQVTELERSVTDPSRWTGTVHLERENFRDKVEVYAILAAPAEGAPSRWMAESQPWAVYFDEPAIPPIEGTLRVQWAEFKGLEREASVPEEAQDEEFYVALEHRPPVVFLNSQFPGLSGLFSDEQARPEAEKALRDAEYRRIAAAVWTEVFHVALTQIKRGEEDEEPDWPELDWQEHALRCILPEVYRDASPTEALTKAYEDFHGDGAMTLQGLGQVAIAQQIGAARSLRRSLDRMNMEGS